MSARTSDGSLAPDLADTDPNLRDGETFEEREWRDAQEPKPRYGHVGHPIAIPTCPLCIALSDSPEVKA